MRLSSYPIQTLKEVPADAEVADWIDTPRRRWEETAARLGSTAPGGAAEPSR